MPRGLQKEKDGQNGGFYQVTNKHVVKDVLFFSGQRTADSK